MTRPGLVLAALLMALPASAAQRGEASYYGTWHHGRTMANGKAFNMHAPTLAHRKLPLGAKVKVCRTDRRLCAKATVTDRGPYAKARNGRPRIADLSKGMARRLDMLRDGVADVRIALLSKPR